MARRTFHNIGFPTEAETHSLIKYDLVRQWGRVFGHGRCEKIELYEVSPEWV